MKKFLPVVTAFFAVLIGSCGATISFTVTQDISEQTVQGVGIPNCDQLTNVPAINNLLKPLSINIENSQEYKKKAPKVITKVTMDKLVLKITDTAKSGDSDIDNFNFLNSIKVYAEPLTGDSDKKVLIGELDPVPDNATEITVKGSGANIVKFLNGDKFKVTTEVDGRAPCDDVSFDGYIVFDIEGEL